MFVLAACAAGNGPAAAQTVPTAHVALRWNDCYGDGGAALRTFACNTNSGAEVLVVSAFPDADVPQLNGAVTTLDILTTGGPLPDWWQFHSAATGFSAGCRYDPLAPGLLTAFDPPASAVNCLDPWQGAAQGAGSVTYPYDFANGAARVRILIGIAGSVPVSAGTEVFMCRLVVRHSKTVGSGSCSGCASGLCIGVNSAFLTQPEGVGSYNAIYPLPGTASDVASWQGEMVMRSYFGLSHGQFNVTKTFTSCQSATEAARPSWGAIKRLYR